MVMNFEELDDSTRRYMLSEFEAEEASGNPYRGKSLSAIGRIEFIGLMRRAIRSGNELTLTDSLMNPSYWNSTESYVLKGIERQRSINVQQASARLGLSEFNTWYVRGLARRLMDEKITTCQIYRAAMPKWAESPQCKAHEGQIVNVEAIYNGHRAGYWPEPGNKSVLSVPLGPSCHHTVRRIKNQS